MQTRTVTCERNDELIVSDSICSIFINSKPATSQTCNTHSCKECKLDGGSNLNWFFWEEYQDIIQVAWNGVGYSFGTGCGCIQLGTTSCIGTDGAVYTRGELVHIENGYMKDVVENENLHTNIKYAENKKNDS